jgi:hypothetical protein
MKFNNALTLVAMGIALAACGGSDKDDMMGSTPPPAPPAPVPTNFTNFVTVQVTEPIASSPTLTPVIVDAITFSFPDDDNPAAFDAVIAAAQ